MAHPDDLILCDGQTGTGVCLGLIGFGEQVRYSQGAGVNRQQRHRKFKVRVRLRDSTNGATGTFKIQGSNDGSSWTDIYVFPLSIPSGSTTNAHARLFDTTFKWVRGNLTALAGGSAPVADAYLTLGAFGV